MKNETSTVFFTVSKKFVYHMKYGQCYEHFKCGYWLMIELITKGLLVMIKWHHRLPIKSHAIGMDHKLSNSIIPNTHKIFGSSEHCPLKSFHQLYYALFCETKEWKSEKNECILGWMRVNCWKHPFFPLQMATLGENVIFSLENRWKLRIWVVNANFQVKMPIFSCKCQFPGRNGQFIGKKEISGKKGKLLVKIPNFQWNAELSSVNVIFLLEISISKWIGQFLGEDENFRMEMPIFSWKCQCLAEIFNFKSISGIW